MRYIIYPSSEFWVYSLSFWVVREVMGVSLSSLQCSVSLAMVRTQGTARMGRVSVLGISELRLCFSQTSWFCWLHQTATFSTKCLQPSAKWLGWDESQHVWGHGSWFSTGKKLEVFLSLWVEFKYLMKFRFDLIFLCLVWFPSSLQPQTPENDFVMQSTYLIYSQRENVISPNICSLLTLKTRACFSALTSCL